MIALWSSGREDEADAMTLEAFDLARHRGNVNYTTWFAGTRIAVLWNEGAWDEAFRLADEFLPATPASQGNPALCRCILANMAIDREDPEAARRLLALVAPGMTSSADLQQQAILYYRTFVEAKLEERFDDILGTTKAWVALALELGYDETAAQALSLSLDVLPSSNGTNGALAELVDLIDGRSTSRRTQGLEAELARVRGVLATRAGEDDAAFDAFAQALAHARERNKARLVASIVADYGAALVVAGRGEDAEPLLDEARELFAQMGSRAGIERLDAALASAAPRVGAAATPASG
jgi:tetratricopeptide (TPR) repeat protein